MKVSRMASLGLAALLLSGGMARAQDTDTDRMKRLEDQIKALQEQIQKLKEDQAARDKAAHAMPGVPGVPTTPMPGQGMPRRDQPPTTNPPSTATQTPLRVTGDVTFRFDSTDERDRQIGVVPIGEAGALRGRFRLRFQTPVSNRSDVEFYLTNGVNVAPTQGFTALSDFFRGKTISFARAYFNYYFGRKEDPKTPSISLGKMQNPFWRGDIGAFASEIFWDNDVNPEGASVHLPIIHNKNLALSNTTGFFTIELPQQRLLTGLTTDTYQIGTQFKVDTGFFHGAASYYVFDNLNSGLLVPSVDPNGFIDTTPGTSAFLLRSGSGLQITNGEYAYGSSEFGFGANTFNIFNLSVQLAPKVRPNQIQPFLHYEFLHNGSVDFENTGHGITVGVSKSRLPDGRATSAGDYTAWATYRDVDADAALGTLADSDLGAGTDYRGYQLAALYRIHDNLAFRAAWHDFKGNPFKTNRVQRLFLDFIRSF